MFLPCAISLNVSRSRGVRVATGERLAVRAAEQHVYDRGVDDRAAARDFPDRARQLLTVGDAFFEEVPASLGTIGEQSERVRGLEVVTQDDDADVRVRLLQLSSGPDTLVGAGRRHADVGEDDVGFVLGDESKQRVEVITHTDQT